MSSEAEILSFDDALSKHKRLLTESLVGFDEGKRVRKIMLDIDSNSSDYEYYFQAGAASRQYEVYKLQTEIDELQKRIDDALAQLELLHFMKTTNSNNAIKILKGESNG